MTTVAAYDRVTWKLIRVFTIEVATPCSAVDTLLASYPQLSQAHLEVDGEVVPYAALESGTLRCEKSPSRES